MSVAFCINGFFRFQQFIIDYTLVIPPNTKHCVPSVAVCPYSRCRWFPWSYQWSLMFRILEIDLFSRVIIWCINDFLLYLASGISQVFFLFSCYLSIGSCGTHFPIFWIFPIGFKCIEMASCVPCNWSPNCFYERHPHRTVLANRWIQIFLWSPTFSVFHFKIPNFEFLNTQSTAIYQEHTYRKLVQAFDAIQ